MSDINVYTLTGRLGNDAELKFSQSGTPIWSASVGVGYGYGDNKGTNWIRVQAFGKRAEALGGLGLTKGSPVGVTGELRVREYDKREGGKGISVEVVAQDIALLGKPKDGARKPAPDNDDIPDF